MAGIAPKSPDLVLPRLLADHSCDPRRIQALIGTSQSTAYAWMSGARSPLPRDIVRLSEAFGIPADLIREAVAADRAFRSGKARGLGHRRSQPAKHRPGKVRHATEQVSQVSNGHGDSGHGACNDCNGEAPCK